MPESGNESGAGLNGSASFFDSGSVKSTGPAKFAGAEENAGGKLSTGVNSKGAHKVQRLQDVQWISALPPSRSF
jgi:hypothetical protein